jgi:hypothetical protein
VQLSAAERLPHQDAIAKVGGIRPLLALADSRYPQTQRSSINALACLARNNTTNQNTIVEFGGLKPLLRIIQPGSGYMHADGMADCPLLDCAFLKGPRSSPLTFPLTFPLTAPLALSRRYTNDVQEQAVFALAQLAQHNHENQSKIGETNAAASLVGLLRRSGVPSIETEVSPCT